MKALDLFCGAGGSAMGLHKAGFDVIGIDINPELNYPFPWVAEDAMPILKRMASKGVGVLREYGLDPDGIDLIWASPPCQSFSAYRRKDPKRVGAKAKDLIAQVRRYLKRIGLPYIIENVEAAPLKNAIKLCGSSFGLDIRRHRLFECSFPVKAPPCDHALHVSRGKRFPERPTGRPDATPARSGSIRSRSLPSRKLWASIGCLSRSCRKRSHQPIASISPTNLERKNMIMISRGIKYELKPHVSDQSETVIVWKVQTMGRCSRCDARGPVLVSKRHGDFYASCCELHLGSP